MLSDRLINALIYPGLGLGMLASEASLLTDEMIGAAAHSLSGIIDQSQPGAPVLPPFKYVADVFYQGCGGGF